MKALIAAFTLATLIASSTFAQSAYPGEHEEQTNESRIINEIVVNGRPIPAGSYQVPANELQPAPSFGVLDEANSVY